MSKITVQRQNWQRWPRVLIAEKRNDDGTVDERRYVPEGGESEIVRCRDCKHAIERRPLNPITGVPCGFTEYRCDSFWNADELPEVEPNGFCAWGEKR